MNDICTGRVMVRKEIDKLKTILPGPDDIFPRILKECREQLVEPIARIFRNSLDTGIVSRLWRQANVVRILKKRDKAESSNYCPISLTSLVGKMLGVIIARAIRKHLDNHKLIKHSQHGFSRERSPA